MTFYIRKALAEDASKAAPLIYEAIGDIAYRLTGENEPPQTIVQLQELFKRTDNRHSYLNTFIAEGESKNILGILVLYSGEDGAKLDSYLERWLEQKSATITTIDVEAHPDEFYIDTICVHPDSRGLGVGTKLLHFAEEVAQLQGYTKLSLNVDVQKTKARQLYERLGYVIKEPWTIINEPFYHMVKPIN